MRLAIGIIGAIICGIAACAYRRGWIIIAYPSSVYAPLVKGMDKKEIMLHWHQHDRWHREATTLLWSDHMATNVYHIINRWLEMMHDEQIIDTRVMLQTVIITPSGSTAYLSFDGSPLPQQLSAYAKLCIIEGLFKTMRENGITAQEIHLLVHHQPLPDAHLDFAHAWPIASLIA